MLRSPSKDKLMMRQRRFQDDYPAAANDYSSVGGSTYKNNFY